MNHRISAGVIVESEGRILVVRHVKADAYDFWVAPGGGVQGDENLRQAAQREAREETGLDVEPTALAYIEEMLQPGLRHCKFWFIGKVLGGTLSADAPEAATEYITEAAWLSHEELRQVQVFPPVLTGRYWHDREAGFQSPVLLELRRMAFW